jgi:hypothetical protein
LKTVEEMSRKELSAHALHLEKEQEEYEQQIVSLRKLLVIAEKSLLYIEGFHIRGIEDQHLQVIRLKATEFLKSIRE